MGRGVTALAEKDATLLMLCFEPQRNPMIPRGADVDDAAAHCQAGPCWTPARPTRRPCPSLEAACAAVVQVRTQLSQALCVGDVEQHLADRAALDGVVGRGEFLQREWCRGARRPRRPAAHPPRPPS